MRAVVNVLAWFLYKLFFFLSSIRSHVVAEIHISRREPFLNSVTVSAALVTDVLKLIYLFSRFSLYSKALNLFDNSTTCAIESSFNFLILNGFAGDFFVIFFNFMWTLPLSNEWSLPQLAPRKMQTSCVDDRQLLLIQM